MKKQQIKKQGILCINLGSTRAATLSAVACYLSVFLTDRRVIQLPSLLRYLLVLGLIVPLRTFASRRAYQAIWLQEGSPLLVHSQRLCQRLAAQLGPSYTVALGMRYGQPSIASALDQLKECDSITILPLYPHYAEATTASAWDAVSSYFKKQAYIPSLRMVSQFATHPLYIQALVQQLDPYVQERSHDQGQRHVLFSYHGLPEQQVLQVGCPKICEGPCLQPSENAEQTRCYRSACFATSRAVAESLQLPADRYHTAFQSRLGRTPWIQPYTDGILAELIAAGVRELVVICPSFVVDCVETLEEISIRAQEQWHALGGETLHVVPCLQESPWLTSCLVEIVQQSEVQV